MSHLPGGHLLSSHSPRLEASKTPWLLLLSGFPVQLANNSCGFLTQNITGTWHSCSIPCCPDAWFMFLKYWLHHFNLLFFSRRKQERSSWLWHLRSSLSTTLITHLWQLQEPPALVRCIVSLFLKYTCISFHYSLCLKHRISVFQKSPLPSHLAQIICDDSSIAWLGSWAHRLWSQAFSQFLDYEENYCSLFLGSISLWKGEEKCCAKGKAELQRHCHRPYNQPWALRSWGDPLRSCQPRPVRTPRPLLLVGGLGEAASCREGLFPEGLGVMPHQHSFPALEGMVPSLVPKEALGSTPQHPLQTWWVRIGPLLAVGLQIGFLTFLYPYSLIQKIGGSSTFFSCLRIIWANPCNMQDSKKELKNAILTFVITTPRHVHMLLLYYHLKPFIVAHLTIVHNT